MPFVFGQNGLGADMVSMTTPALVEDWPLFGPPLRLVRCVVASLRTLRGPTLLLAGPPLTAKPEAAAGLLTMTATW